VAELRTKYFVNGSETILRALLAPEPDKALEPLRQLPRFGSVLGDLMRNHLALMRTRGFRYDSKTFADPTSIARNSSGFCLTRSGVSIAAQRRSARSLVANI
jgi:hypothetical protein